MSTGLESWIIRRNLSKMPGAKASAKTHTGNIRSGNEDSLFSDDELGLWLVADGMGGHEAGEVASAIVAATVENEVKNGTPLSDAIQKSHLEVLNGAQRGEGASGMGSTIIAVHQCGENQYEIGWVGDSRAYLWEQISEENGQLRQLSTDHSYVQALLESGAITAAEVDNHPDKNIITQCLGSLELSQVRVDTIHGEWQGNQKIILCSDGLSDELSDSEIANIMNQNRDRSDALNVLIQSALDHGGKDNVTVVVIDAPVASGKSSDSAVDDLDRWVVPGIAVIFLLGFLLALAW